jgi:hypothetical protein
MEVKVATEVNLQFIHFNSIQDAMFGRRFDT